MKNTHIYLLIAIFIFSVSCSKNDTILRLDFNGEEFSPEEELLLNHELIQLSRNNSVDSSNCIKASYVGYERGSKRIVQDIALPYAVNDATLEFDVKFNAPFNFVKGGKLHGLGPKNKVTGGRTMRTDGWSGRIMFKEDGKVAPYIYHQLKTYKYGVGKKTEYPVFTPGKWNHVSIYVKVNDPPEENNGEFELHIDGEMIDHMDSLQYRAIGGDSTLICNLLFSTFFGGHIEEWAPKNENNEYTIETAWFDNFVVYRGKKQGI